MTERAPAAGEEAPTCAQEAGAESPAPSRSADPIRDAFDVIAVRYGTLPSRKRHLYLGWDTYGEPDAAQALDYFFYVLSNARQTILLDTGFEPESARRRRRLCSVAPREAVVQLGIDPTEVTHIVVSHCHWDHIGNLDAYPQAELLVPGRELEFWTSKTAQHIQFSSHVDASHVDRLVALDREGKVTRFGGRLEIFAGLTAFDVGGHSPGQQIFLVETAEKPLILTSDAVHLYEELELNRPFRVVANLVEMYEAYELIRALQRDCGAIVVPGHDPSVATQFPAVHDARFERAYRLA